MRVVAIVNQKGGCGKTTTAVNLAAVLARDGARTLLVDMDPQSHCAAGLGVPDHTLERTIADAMLADVGAAPRLAEHAWEVGRGLSLVPSSVALAALEAPNGPLAARFDRDRRLARVLAAWRDDFDWCVIDCPPTIGLLTFNALRAADLVLVPVETGYFSLKGAEKQIETIRSIVRRFGRDIPFRLLPTLVNESRALSRDVIAALARRFPEALLPHVVREHEELRDAASYGQSIVEFAPGSDAEGDFVALARWLSEFPPEAVALEGVGGFDPPVIETFAGLPGEDRPAVPVPGSAPREPDAAARGRAEDLVSRLRQLAGRGRGSEPVGGGFGVRAGRDGAVVFSQPASERGVFVIGSFNAWSPVATPLAATSCGTRVEASVTLPPGRHAYRLVVDGVETLDEFNLHRETIDADFEVNLVEVPAAGGVVATAGGAASGVGGSRR